MGTTLTGTTPQDTYDSLIKVTDNGPIGATAKYLSDGLGNDSKLALSTGNVGINITAPKNQLHVNGQLQVGFVDASNDAMVFSWNGASTYGAIQTFSSSNLALNPLGNNVGIGTSSPAYKLEADVTDATAYSAANTLTASPILWLYNNTSTAGVAATIRLDSGQSGGNGAATISSVHVGNGSSAITFGTRHLNSDVTERVRILSTGGITFNGDTAAANALDDYEEGTWTPSFFSGSYTYNFRVGKYTKIGNVVTANFVINWSANNLPADTSAMQISLPFATSSTTNFRSTATIGYISGITLTGVQVVSAIGPGSTSLDFYDVRSGITPLQILNSGLAAGGGEIQLSMSYLV